MSLAPSTTANRLTSPAGRGVLKDDLVAGLTTALVLVPQAIGYAMLAGLPPSAGLFAATFALVAYAALGTSSALAIGPVAIDSLLTAAALGSLGLVDPETRWAAAGLLALMVGTIQIAMGALHLGHLANFLSAPVVLGFTTAAASMIVLTQLPALFGLPSTAGDLVAVVRHLVVHVPAIDVREAALGLVVAVALSLIGKRWPRLPRVALVLAVATVIVELVPPLASLHRLGTLPAAFPWPHFGVIDRGTVFALLPHALTIAGVAFLEAFSVAKQFADRCGEPSPSRELVALGAANVTSAMSGGFPITGGLGRSSVLVGAGARTRFAGVATALFVLVASLLLGRWLALVPRAALAAVIAMSAASLVDPAGMKRVVKVKPLDAAWMLVTLVATLALGFQWGILVGVGVSISAYLFESTRPHVAVLGRIPSTTTYRNVARYPAATTVPGMLIVRIDAELYFGNATFLRETMAELERQAGEVCPVQVVVLEANGVNMLDSSAEAALSRIVDDYERRGITFAIASVKGPVRDVMKRSGLWKRLGSDRLYLDVHSAVEALAPTPVPEGGPHALPPALRSGIVHI